MSWLEQVKMLGTTPGVVALSFYINLWRADQMLDKNVAGQKWPVIAVNGSTGLPVTGDAANISANLSIDGAAPGATNDVNPTEMGTTGTYYFDLLQAETNGDMLVLAPVSATSNVLVISLYGAVNTRNTVNSEVIAAMTSQGYTVARAGNLDDLDLSIVTAVAQVLTGITQPDTIP